MAAQGTLLYVDQGPVNGGFFFMKLFIQEGILQVKTKCSEELYFQVLQAMKKIVVFKY